jgi:hypothetical protein
VALNSVKRPKNSVKRLKSQKLNTPKQSRQPCTAETAQQLNLGFFSRCKNLVKSTGDNPDRNVNKYRKLPDSEKVAKLMADYSTTNGGVFGQFQSIKVGNICFLNPLVLSK